MNETLKIALGFEAREQLIVTRTLTVLQSFFTLFEVNAELMIPTLQKIFGLVTFTLPLEPKVVDEKWILSEDSLAVRRKACSSLVRYGMQIPELLLVPLALPSLPFSSPFLLPTHRFLSFPFLFFFFFFSAII